MGKRKKTNMEHQDSSREYVVMNKEPMDYKVFDVRAKKPICFMDNPLTGKNGSMVMQEIDKIDCKVSGRIVNFDYFPPNNVGILLSIKNRARVEAQEIYNEYLLTEPDSSQKDNKTVVIEKSRLLYDYIERVQASIVFGYTALEAFCNLSIPDEYQYANSDNSKGILEIYDKRAIERWVSLKVKISEILVDVYKTKKIKPARIWNDFLKFENFRHEIIHQKTINSTGFYKQYFQENFCELCNTPEQVMKFFFDEREDKKTTDPLWPWVINSNNEFPVSYEMSPNNFEVIGNIYEGRYPKNALNRQ